MISGGGTGGHVFPAIAIAHELKRVEPDCEILFVGAKGKMEMEKVPAAGFRIVGLWISGLQRKISFSNLLFPVKLLFSIVKSLSLIQSFKPGVVVGVGGYASGPLMIAAGLLGVPTVIQEQNSYPGITNRRLAAKAAAICVAYPNMEKFFPPHKIFYTGNPVRSEIGSPLLSQTASRTGFGLDPKIKTLLVIGGSLGARTINLAIKNSLENFAQAGIQVIWQTGKTYAVEARNLHRLKEMGIVPLSFIPDMAAAYAAADLVVSRAGALSVSELALAGKASILIPSPNVAEDHQTKNARVLTDQGSAILLEDSVAPTALGALVCNLIKDEIKLGGLQQKIKNLGRPHASKEIAGIVLQQIKG